MDSDQTLDNLKEKGHTSDLHSDVWWHLEAENSALQDRTHPAFEGVSYFLKESINNIS